QLLNISVFSPKGELITLIGREGRGPGEFQNIQSLHIDQSDTLWVLDGRELRISSFTFDGDSYEHITSAAIEQLRDGRPQKAYKIENDGFLVEFSLLDIFSDMDSSERTYYGLMSHIDSNGNVLDEEVFHYRSNEVFINRQNGRMMIMTLPFTPMSTTAFNNEGLVYIGLGDSLKISSYKLNGSLDHTIGGQVKPRKITLDDTGGSNPSRTSDIGNRMPDVKPAFKSFIVDDINQVWVNLGDLEDEINTWVVLSKDSELVSSFTFPASFDIQKVQNNRIYGINRDEDEVQSLMVYAY
ncbi:MAG: 6-bladed beta-propeller, partial [Balneolales bacterium]